jgi:hypothetical protein
MAMRLPAASAAATLGELDLLAEQPTELVRHLLEQPNENSPTAPSPRRPATIDARAAEEARKSVSGGA